MGDRNDDNACNGTCGGTEHSSREPVYCKAGGRWVRTVGRKGDSVGSGTCAVTAPSSRKPSWSCALLATSFWNTPSTACTPHHTRRMGGSNSSICALLAASFWNLRSTDCLALPPSSACIQGTPCSSLLFRITLQTYFPLSNSRLLTVCMPAVCTTAVKVLLNVMQSMKI